MFLSINLSKEIVTELSRLQHAIRSNLSSVDKLLLVKPESIHLTLKFFADVDKSKLPQILEALRSVALSIEKFSIDTDKLNYFTAPNGRPRVVFLSFKKSVQLSKLHEDIGLKLAPLGFNKDEFKSHATLFRVKFLRDKFRLIEILKHVKVEPLKLEINSIELFESVLMESGPTYTLVEKFELK
jgi:2'-5' RNA ligase